MWKKNFRHRKLQTFMLFFIIMLCTLAICGSISILISMTRPYHELAKECQSATATVWTMDYSKENMDLLKKEFEALDEVDHVYMFKAHYITEEMSSNGKIIESFTNLSEYNKDVFGTVRYVEGIPVSEKELSDDECIMPACLCIEYDLKLGDTIKIKMTDGTLSYKIRAIYAEPYGSTTAFDNYVLVKEYPSIIEPRYHIRLYGIDGVDGGDIDEAYREKYNGKMNCTINGLETEISNNLISGTLLGAILLAIGGILLLVSGLIINFMMRNTMIKDIKTIAIYKTIGYSSRVIIRMYLTFYFIVVSAGCICGILSAGIFVKSVMEGMYRNIGAKSGGNILLPGIFCYILITGFVLLVIFLNIRKTKNVKPAQALNGLETTNTKKKKHYRGNLKFQFSALGIALRTMIRDKKGTVGIIITSLVTIFAMNFAVISLDVCNNLKKDNDYWLGIEDCEIMISLGEGVSAEEIEELLENEKEITKMIPSNLESYRFNLDWKKNIEFTIVFPFIYDDFDEAGYEIIEGRNPKNGDEIAISNKVAVNTGKKVGDYLNVNLNNETFSLLITGIYQTYYSMGKSARMVTDTFTKRDIPFTYDTVSVYLKDDTDVLAYRDKINEMIGNKGSAVLRTDMFAAIMTIIMTPQKKAIPPMTVLILLIGVTNIFCIVLLKNSNNKKLNGIYKCIGYSTGHLMLSNVYYVCIIAIGSLIIAIPLIRILYPKIMTLSLSIFGLLEYRIRYDAGHMILINFAILLSFIISTVLSSRSLKRVNVRDLVQE